MTLRHAAPVFALITFALPASLADKGLTTKITISTTDQAVPIEVNGPTLGMFHIWRGPGVIVNHVPQTEGFIIDWSKGLVEHRPSGLQRYRVSFYTGCPAGLCEEKEVGPKLSYVVLYEYDAAAKKGYVYLPGKGDPEYQINTRSILRGLEGGWFVAISEWQEYVTPIILKIQRAIREP